MCKSQSTENKWMILCREKLKRSLKSLLKSVLDWAASSQLCTHTNVFLSFIAMNIKTSSFFLGQHSHFPLRLKIWTQILRLTNHPLWHGPGVNTSQPFDRTQSAQPSMSSFGLSWHCGMEVYQHMYLTGPLLNSSLDVWLLFGYISSSGRRREEETIRSQGEKSTHNTYSAKLAVCFCVASCRWAVTSSNVLYLEMKWPTVNMSSPSPSFLSLSLSAALLSECQSL